MPNDDAPSAVTLADLSGADVHRHLARLRAGGPVSWVESMEGFVVTGYPAALGVLRDPVTYTVDDPRFSTAQVVGRSMLSTDGNEHARHRAPFVAPFRPRQVTERFATAIEAQVARRLDALEARGDAELRAGLAGPLAAAVVARSLGLDGDDEGVIAELLGWYRTMVAAVGGVAEGRPVPDGAHGAMRSLVAALEPAIGAASVLGEARAAGGLTTAEVAANAAVLMFGGIETTESMILNALWFVLSPGVERPAADEGGAIAAAVEESSRMEPAAAFVDRYATVDGEIAGTRVPAGSFVTVSLAGANRDPVEFAHPNRFDPSRPNLRRQLAFATGPHVCLGMDLARLETIAAVRGVLTRWPGVRLTAESPSPTGLVFRKPGRLDVVWD
ncbi:MAG: cytochrome P450 [Desertimonas sp.]